MPSFFRAPKGIGIGLRQCHFDAVLSSTRTLDWLEFVPENFVGRGGRDKRILEACAERWPLIPHGVSASLGGPDVIDAAWVTELRHLLDAFACQAYSDHLCWVSAGGTTFYDLLPVPFSAAAVSHVVASIRELTDRLEREIWLENISYYAVMPGSSMDEGSFVRAVVEESGCGLLLDLNNVYVNAMNHGHDPREVLWKLPVERTRQIHLAGFLREGSWLIDHHGAAISQPVWELYREVVAEIGPVPTLVEWDTDIPGLDIVLDEADKARAIVAALEQQSHARSAAGVA